MLSFAGDVDVLVSTTIIESGLDIPEANTLIIERADALGLAQLYQIRGRVGRSDVPAHAYLFYPDGPGADAGSAARLATLADHTELGAGFAIAMRDLEIRGRGRSARRGAVGTRCGGRLRALRRAARRGGRRAGRNPSTAARPVRVEAQIDAFVPSDYIRGEAQKIDLHRRLALAESEDELRELRAAAEDRFGLPPEPVENLLAIQEAKLKLARLGADYLVYRGRTVVGPLVPRLERAADLLRRDRRLLELEPRGPPLRGRFGRRWSGSMLSSTCGSPPALHHALLATQAHPACSPCDAPLAAAACGREAMRSPVPATPMLSWG